MISVVARGGPVPIQSSHPSPPSSPLPPFISQRDRICPSFLGSQSLKYGRTCYARHKPKAEKSTDWEKLCLFPRRDCETTGYEPLESRCRETRLSGQVGSNRLLICTTSHRIPTSASTNQGPENGDLIADGGWDQMATALLFVTQRFPPRINLERR
jgi:hypothetical protein